ncbi:hypothetical protein DPX16_2645 [Anabarilius grahami]|uniref:Uncharacterized protein n=1 Tax=Anabarilius grahami TaxID=495550 RepID=A0A3N0Y4L0_ANAGA|nr:hypothetical protein DPX16_2645 [Anabarilius grahami]
MGGVPRHRQSSDGRQQREEQRNKGKRNERENTMEGAPFLFFISSMGTVVLLKDKITINPVDFLFKPLSPPVNCNNPRNPPISSGRVSALGSLMKTDEAAGESWENNLQSPISDHGARKVT